MPPTKVFAAVLAALAVPMVNASPCKPKAPTTTDAALPGITTSETVTALTSGALTSGTETGTATTATSPATTTEAACSQFTPVEPQPFDCGKTGTAPNCADKIIGTPSTCVDWQECGNTCGKTVGCKSFSIQGNTCTLYETIIEELGFTPGLGSHKFYDLELCFTCAEESSATSVAETATGTQTTETAAGTQTTETDTETATGAQTTATSGTETATGTETTEIGIDTATGTQTTETAAGPQTTDTTTETGAGIQTTETSAESSAATQTTETSTAANTDTTETATSTETISESISESGTTTAAGATTTTEAAITSSTEAADTTTTEAATTTTGACTAGYTTIPGAPIEKCNVEGMPNNGADSYETCTVSGPDECAAKCAASEQCATFAYYSGMHHCKLFAEEIASMNVSPCNDGICEEDGFFYELNACYAKCDGGASPATTTETSSDALTTTTGAATTTTEAAITSSTEVAVTSSTEAATTTTEAAVITTTTAEMETSTTEAATTTTEAAPVCTNYIPKPDRPSSCGKEGRVACSDSEKLGNTFYAYNADKCGKVCGTTEGCKTFSYNRSNSKCQLYKSALESLQFRPCTTGVKFYDLEKCYTCQNEVTPNPPATCSKYVPNFASCGQNTHCGTPGSICEEERIPNAGDASCLENCAKSCISFGDECKYFSYRPASNRFSAKCNLYKSGKITKNYRYSTKFYEKPCFKCQNQPPVL